MFRPVPDHVQRPLDLPQPGDGLEQHAHPLFRDEVCHHHDAERAGAALPLARPEPADVHPVVDGHGPRRGESEASQGAHPHVFGDADEPRDANHGEAVEEGACR